MGKLPAADLPVYDGGDLVTVTDYLDPLAELGNYLGRAGADIAAFGAGNTLAFTNEVHAVTVAGGWTLDNLSHPAPQPGQRALFYFENAGTVRNNGGGAANIRTQSGVDEAVAAGVFVGFCRGGDGLWRPVGSPFELHVYTWDTLPTAYRQDGVVLLSDSFNAGALKVSKLLKWTNADPAHPWEPADGTNDTPLELEAWSGALFTDSVWHEWIALGAFPTETVFSRIGFDGTVGNQNVGFSGGFALGTTAAGTDICSNTASSTGGQTPLHVTASKATDTTIAAAGAVHVSVYGGRVEAGTCTVTLQLKNLAGAV